MQYKLEDYNEQKHDLFKALSVRQPYANYIATGEKRIEVRSRPTSFRGDILICSSQHPTKKDADGYGCSIAKVEIYDCKPLSELSDQEWEDTCLPREVVEKIRQNPKGYAWMLKRPRRSLEFPVKGQLGIWNLVYTKGVIIPYPYALDDWD